MMSDDPHRHALPKTIGKANASLRAARAELGVDILRGRSGLALARRLSDLTDRWLQTLADEAFSPSLRASVDLYAIGGYGRRELAFHSDVDLLIHLASPDLIDHPDLAASVERLMRWSREPGLRLKHAVRTPDQFQHLLESDIASATALLDLRPLTPEPAASPDLRDRAIDHLRGADDGRGFAAHLLDEYRRRVHRHGRTVYLLEPHLKSGEGGLRDLQSARWAAAICHHRDASGPSAHRDLDALLTLRHRLHWLFGRPQDRLGFREQRALVALRARAADLPGDLAPEQLEATRRAIVDRADAPPTAGDHPAIEALMATYYRRARAISGRTARLLRQLATDPDAPHRRHGPFVHRAGQLALGDDQPLSDDLLFDALQQAADHDLLLTPALTEAIQARVQTWPAADDLSADLVARFADLLTDPDAHPATSDRLLRLGLITAVIPEFTPLICHVQHDLYHVYTTDIHSLKCLEKGRALLAGDDDTPWPFFANLAPTIDDPQLFLWACLLHDVGKNRGGQHSQKGARLVDAIGPRLQLSPRRTRRLALLVRHHLLLSNTSRRRDIADPQVVDEVADAVQSLDNLALLSALTYCDTATVGPEVMNDWKASLMIRLHRAVEARLLDTPQAVPDLRPLLHQHPDADATAVDAFIDALQDHALAAIDVDDLRHYFGLYLQALQAGDRLAIAARPLPDRSVTEVVVCSPDRVGILADIAGAIASLGINIMAADILTIDDMAVDIFHIAHFNPRAIPPTPPRPVDAASRLTQLTERIDQVLGGQFDVDHHLQRLQHQSTLPPRPVPATTTAVDHLPDASDDFTVLEVRAPDRLGLLYAITDALRQSGVDTRISRIDSLGHQAVDTFYLCTADGKPLPDERIDALTDQLLAIL